MIYLDYSATSPLLPCAKKAMITAMDLVGNPSALHTPGHLAMNKIEEAREEIAKLIGAKPEEILFTSGGSESNNTVTNIFAGEKVAVSAIEHPSLLESARLRCETTILPVDDTGMVHTIFSSDLRNNNNRQSETRPSLVSIMLANNEIGTINDIKKLAAEAHAAGALFHTDATQALGKIAIDVKELDVDYMTLSSHKIGGPVGIGALYIKQGAKFKPFIVGGHQERSRRAGTYQTVNIAGFGAAARYTRKQNLPNIYLKKIMPLRNQLAAEILKKVPYSSVNTPLKKNGASLLALPNILNCSFEAAEGESIQLYLDAEGDIITSTGSACASGDGKPSHVIMATKNDAEVAHSSVRFSFGPESSKEDIDAVMNYLPNIVKRLQGISTLTAGKIRKEDSYYGK
ncbi:cysteine desulfurase [Candidatus Saccharibacteria bacterium]|nr:cysteine desulfurase [Candidatus Saccharibacteria bacterium]